MLKSLLVENFIIVEHLNLEFKDGLQILSGETGAGKSILVGAIQLSLGGIVRAGMLFDKSKVANIETCFKVDPENKALFQLIEKYEIEAEDNEIYFRKEISISLRGKSFINGRRVSNSIIKEFNAVLLDFHGQRDQQKLFDVEYQLELLDKYGDLEDIRNSYQHKYQELLQKTDKLKKLRSKEKEQLEKMKLYEYQLNEINSFDLKESEDVNLQQEMHLLNHAEEIIKTSANLEYEVYEQENSIYDAINNFIFQLANYEKDNQSIAKAVISLRESANNLEEAVEQIRDIQSSIDLDQDRLEHVEERLNEINKLKMKYKMELPGIMEYSIKIESDLTSFSSYSKNIKILEEEIINNLKNLQIRAEKLSSKRKKAAKKLEKELEQNVRKLAIPDASFQIKFDKERIESVLSINDFGINGIDSLEFYFSANKGKEVQPLKDSASGGELSRFLLAIKKILADKLSSRSVIFDEIDTGIGGKTADLLGEFIADISKYHQVICITHLAQIAAYANSHYAIYKKASKQKTVVDIMILNSVDRKKEIARMFSGSDTDIALQYADEIINKKRERVK